jgi:hypothetical protein
MAPCANVLTFFGTLMEGKNMFVMGPSAYRTTRRHLWDTTFQQPSHFHSTKCCFVPRSSRGSEIRGWNNKEIPFTSHTSLRFSSLYLVDSLGAEL